MDYQWLIVVLVVLSLVGSVSWVMPTPVQRAQAKIRKLAMEQGVQVRIGKLQGPREQGEMAPDSHLATGYWLPRDSKVARTMSQTHNWEIFKANGLATKGLPEGWCWNRGEGALNESQLQLLDELIAKLPKDVYAMGGSPVSAIIYWHEISTPAELDELVKVLQTMLAESL